MHLKCTDGGEQPHEHRPNDSTKQTVRDLYSAGIPQNRIAERLDISEPTLRKHYRHELDENMDNMIARLASNLYQDALNGDSTAREFWLKCRGKWSYAKPVEEKEKDDKMLSILEKLADKV